MCEVTLLISLSDSIEDIVTQYTGYTSAQLHQILGPGASSQAGFLKTGDRLGDVIKADALTLESVSHLILYFFCISQT
jgi:hypothetical protein